MAGGATVLCTVERRSVLLLDATVPVIVGTVIVGGIVHGGGGTRSLALLVGVAAALTLVARRRAPAWTLAVSGGLVLVLFHVEAEAASIAVVAPGVALYSLALTRGRLEQLLAAVATVAAVVVTDVVQRSKVGLLETLGHVTLVGIPLLFAETLRTRRSYVAVLRERLALAEQTRELEAQQRAEHERMRIARDLHDVVAHTLTTINVQAATAAQLLDVNPGHARGALEAIEDASRDAIGELRAILGVLRGGDRAEAPRLPAPGLEDVAELVERERQMGVDVGLAVSGVRPQRLPDGVSLAAYRIVQESLTNVRRHAVGAAVRVELAFAAGGLGVRVENGAARVVGAAADGGGAGRNRGGVAVGTAGADAIGVAGVGIVGMRERAAAVGGTLWAEPVAGGFCVNATLPYAANCA